MAQHDIGSFSTCGQERMIFFNFNQIQGCCTNLKTGATPHLGDYGAGGGVDIDELVAAKRAHLAAVRRGETPDACRDCPSWQPNEWPETPYLFTDVNIGHFTACNTDCYYCRSNSNSASKPVSARNAPRLLPALKTMVERGYVAPDAIIRFGGGEPTIAPEFEETVNYFIGAGRRFFMNTSGVKYSPAIERMLRVGRPDNRLVVSMDSASAETYKVIKRIDVGKRVWDNIAKYAQIRPEMVEVKYIVLPENWHETGEFIRKCNEIGVQRVSFDLDCNPFMAGIPGSLTDELIDGIAVLIHGAKRCGMSVYWSGGGAAVWEIENGHARVQEALQRITGDKFKLEISASGFILLVKAAKKLDGGFPLTWGRSDDVTAIPLNSEKGAIYLQEGCETSVHRIEQSGIKVSPGEPCTAEVVARSAGRSGLMIELRDSESGVYTRAKYDLNGQRIIDAIGDNAAVSLVDDEWVSCQLSLTPCSSSVVFAVTLLDEQDAHVYEGTGRAGVHMRPLAVYPHRAQ
jgi:pyruvate-formate lyase-activating enzyme